MECSLGITDDALSSTSSDPDVSLWEQHSEQLADYKKELASVYEELVLLDLEEDDDQFILHSKLEKLHFATFGGDVLQWRQFWVQFSVSMHDRSNLSNAEKLVYLQQAFKHGTAKNAIVGLSRSGDHYQEAVDCLMSRYNRPCLIHRAHVRVIMEATSLKDDSGKELR